MTVSRRSPSLEGLIAAVLHMSMSILSFQLQICYRYQIGRAGYWYQTLSLVQRACDRVSQGFSRKQRGQGVAAVTDAPLGSIKPCVTAATQVCKPCLSHLLHCNVLTLRPAHKKLCLCTASLSLQRSPHTESNMLNI